MGLFDSLLKLTLDVVTTPLALISDTLTASGTFTDQKSAMEEKMRQLARDLDQLNKEITK
jgi:hypothetical protein